MIDPTSAPWHRESYERLMNERLPALLAARLPLAQYAAKPADHGSTWTVTLTVRSASGDVTATFSDIPGPDDQGIFTTGGQRRVVVPAATKADLATSDFLCVGDQLQRIIERRLGEAPPDLQWDPALLRNWVALDDRINAFLSGQITPETEALFGWSTVQVLDDTNWLARHTHLRRIVLPKRRTDTVPTLPISTELIDASERGRACPFETPEGPNIGRVLSVARGAQIRDGKLVIVDDAPRAGLGLTASMVPLLQHDDANRLLMGANMMRQWLVPPNPEPALVQTGLEPDAPDFWCGRNLLTAFTSWGPGTFEDGIIISASASRRLGIGGSPVEVGDKLSNRHGTKGVVSTILPDHQMPHLADGRAVDLIFNFIGLHARMNFGQLREAVLGLLAQREGQPIISPPFAGMSDEDLGHRLADAGLPDSGMTTLRDHGQPLPRPATVGYVYWGLTHHLARKHLDASPQPASFLQYQVLRDLGATELARELYNTQSAERPDAATLAARLAQGDIEQAAPRTPTFRRLRDRLAIAGIAAELDADGQLRFSTPQPAADALSLACPIQHRWMKTGTDIVSIGSAPHLPEYRTVVIANAQIDRLLQSHAPRSLVDRAASTLQAAVAALFDSLLRPDDLQMANSVAFSGRAVIAPGGDLRIDQCGLPDELAWHLFGPIAARHAGIEAVRSRTPEAAKELDRVMADSWVILCREPAVIPTALLAFHPLRIPEPVIRLHPQCCAPMNADFDGDQVTVYLPITPAGQREAAELLSVAAHLRRDPTLSKWLVPAHESLWGLAELSRSSEGRAQLTALAGFDLTGGNGFVTRASLQQALTQLLQNHGPQRALDMLESLARLGFDVARKTGASLNPFAHRTMPRPPAPPTGETTYQTAMAIQDDLADVLIAGTDYDALDIGPQLLAVKSGARGAPHHLVWGLICRTVKDCDARLHYFPESLLGGLSADAAFLSCIGARIGLADAVLHPIPSMRQAYHAAAPRGPEGFHVLARAMRSPNPGPVFARAALTGEIDPLTDINSRLFVGLPPRHP